MSPHDDCLRHTTRRHFFRDCAMGLGTIALAELLDPRRGQGADATIPLVNPLEPKSGHFAARARSVIYLFMAGGPSQLELFEYKPELQKRNDQPIPESFVAGKRFAFMDTFAKERPKLLATKRRFGQHG